MSLAQQDMYLNPDTSDERGIKTFGTMTEAQAFIRELNEEG